MSTRSARTARVAGVAALVAVLAACARGRPRAGGEQDSVEAPGPSAVGGWPGQLRPPAGADSAAVEAWIAAQQARCAGRVVRVFTDFPVAESGGAPFWMRRYFEGIECQQP